MSELAGKRIAIDVSIYLYKFTGDGALLENMYLMLSIFRHYRITPVFVFDGKPPDEKRELLDQRKEDKSVAKLE
jgi:5'-3' exonuclease